MISDNEEARAEYRLKVKHGDAADQTYNLDGIKRFIAEIDTTTRSDAIPVRESSEAVRLSVAAIILRGS